MLIQLLTALLLLTTIVNAQLESPCSKILKYEPINSEQPDRWFAEISLSTPEDLEGVWLKIYLDRKVDLLGNWFAEAVSDDNIVFSIRDPQYKLESGPPVLVRFFVKYNAASVIPTVKKILLNGRTICPIQQETPRVPILHISSGRSTGRPLRTTSRPQRRRPLDNVLSLPNSTENDDGFFRGDFHNDSNAQPPSRPSTPTVQTVQCGTVQQQTNASPLITYGQETTPGQWPWHASLNLFESPDIKYICGGTLISDSYVVTAAHCVTKKKTAIPIPKEKLVIYLGKLHLISFSREVQDRQVETITVHPEFNSSVYFNDIALLKLDTPVEINNFVRPCCLWEGEDTNIRNIEGENGVVVGWGYNENGELSKTLMQAELPVVSTGECLDSNRNFFAQFKFRNNFCVGFKNDTSVCNGDSGGGLVFPRPGTSGKNKIWQLRGVVSLGVAGQNGGFCDPKQYSLFTDAAKYVHWIEQTMRGFEI